MKFSRLRLSGFKSFVEPTELLVEPGLTGIVGPNGCGKSNLVEALRWVMGESSTKNVRAAEMDDVIFSGTATRPARNMAEVAVTLDNEDRKAPPHLNGAETIEVARRIEREAGSAYRINGADVRARDVQLLFADAAAGARSPALVRQGQIGEIINAKPQARRRILEEAAGITGLHARRHEAELKLRAAETNLSRLDDVVGQLETQLQGLKRQARQAIRYRDLSAAIRRFEAAQLYLAWKDAEEAAAQDEARLREATQTIAARTRAASEAGRTRDAEAEALPSFREEEAVRAAVLQRLSLEMTSLDREEAESRRRHAEIEARLGQLLQDLKHEQEILGDAEAVAARLGEEEASLLAAEKGEADERSAAAAALQAASDELGAAQEAADAAQARYSELTALGNALTRRLEEQSQRARRLDSELQAIKARRAELVAEQGGTDDAARLSAALDSTAAAVAQAESASLQAEAAHQEARSEEARRRQSFEEARREAERLSTEIGTLTKVLGVGAGDLWPPLIDAVDVAAGYETALAAALGDEIEAPADEAAPVHWRALPPLVVQAPLPAGAEPLLRFVQAPPALVRRLSHTGLVERSGGAALQPALKPGQRLVSREGDLWRWDGFSAAAEAPIAAAKRLAERNRLGALEQSAAEARVTAETAREDFEAARQNAEAAAGQERQAREAWRAATAPVEAARANLGAHERAVAEKVKEAVVLDEAARRLAEQLADAQAAASAADAEAERLPKMDGVRNEVELLREHVNRSRAAYGEARARHDGLEGQSRMRSQRLTAIAAERQLWLDRGARATAQVEVLESRAAEARASLIELSEMPARFQGKRAKLLSLTSEAEAHRRAAADALQEAENRAKAAEAATRSAEEALAEAREQQARLEARSEAADQRKVDARRRIAEAFRCEPDEVPAHAQLDLGKLPEPAEIEPRLAQLKDQRERLGPVNLRAEEEAREVSAELDRLTAERDDLVQAIQKLRQGIASLNREGRQRLLEAFENVNNHFGALFTRLFGGGKAELKLVESEDPLEAGLELIAHPPGKRPQVLSLLSGGEQALTAMALILAVFLTNPSPICVLDEVDAPLDDSNVERFCDLLEAMLERTDTRFLIITHNPITMSRMHRLYGVTMMERGVSQLVSVDLQSAERLAEVG